MATVNKSTENYRTIPEYLNAVPRPPKERYEEIKKDVQEKGQQYPIYVNEKNEILDGYTRYQICQELGIKPKTETKTFPNKLEEERFVYAVNVKRRDLSDFVHIELSLKIHEIDLEIAKNNSLSNLKQNQSSMSSQKDIGRLSHKIAEESLGKKTQHYTVEKVIQIIKKSPEKEKQALRENKKTINEVYQKLKKEEKKQELQNKLRQNQVKLPKTVTLHNQDFRELKLKSNSVGLIITDPPYAEKYLSLYEDLGKHASQVLRDGGSLLCYAGHFAIGRIINMVEKHGLKFHWPLVVLHSGPSASVFGYKVMVGYKPLLWFTKGKYEGEFVSDVKKSEFQGKELHDWAQSTIESDYYIKYMTQENEIVYDPFMGQGTFGISTIKLKRQFIGCEIDKNHFENARRLLSIASKP